MSTDALKLLYNQGLLSLFTKHNRKEKRLICPKCHVIEGKKFAVRCDSQTLIASHSNNLWQVIKRILIGGLSQTVSFAFSLTGKLITGGSLKGPGRQKKYRPGSRKMGLWSMAFLEINLKRKEFCFFFLVVSHPGERSVSIIMSFVFWSCQSKPALAGGQERDIFSLGDLCILVFYSLPETNFS